MPTPLTRIPLTNTNRPLDFFVEYGHDRGLLVNQDYQRGHVWGTQRKRDLIKSLMLGLPIGAIILNNRIEADFTDDTPDRRACYAVIDGKQRISAMRGFVRDDFGVPAHWFRPDEVTPDAVGSDGMVTWSGMTESARRRFENVPVPCSSARVATLAEERMIFDLINGGGVPQGQTDHDA